MLYQFNIDRIHQTSSPTSWTDPRNVVAGARPKNRRVSTQTRKEDVNFLHGRRAFRSNKADRAERDPIDPNRAVQLLHQGPLLPGNQLKGTLPQTSAVRRFQWQALDQSFTADIRIVRALVLWQRLVARHHQKRLFRAAAPLSGVLDGHPVEDGGRDCSLHSQGGSLPGRGRGLQEQGARAASGHDRDPLVQAAEGRPELSGHVRSVMSEEDIYYN